MVKYFKNLFRLELNSAINFAYVSFSITYNNLLQSTHKLISKIEKNKKQEFQNTVQNYVCPPICLNVYIFIYKTTCVTWFLFVCSYLKNHLSLVCEVTYCVIFIMKFSCYCTLFRAKCKVFFFFFFYICIVAVSLVDNVENTKNLIFF